MTRVIAQPDFSGTEMQLTTHDISAIEAEYGIRFLDEFREHYLRWNGGRPAKALFAHPEGDFQVSEFLPIRFRTSPSITMEQTIDALRESKLLSAHLVPFAIDPGGDFYVFSAAPGEVGAIYLLRGEYFDEPERLLEPVCSSLRTMLDGLQHDP